MTTKGHVKEESAEEKQRETNEFDGNPTTTEFFGISPEEEQDILNEAQQRLQIKVTPLDRIIVESYIKQGYITQFEIDDVLISISERNQKPSRVTAWINDVCTSVLGMLVTPLLVKWIEMQGRKMDYVSDEDKIKADYRAKLLNEMLEG